MPGKRVSFRCEHKWWHADCRFLIISRQVSSGRQAQCPSVLAARLDCSKMQQVLSAWTFNSQVVSPTLTLLCLTYRPSRASLAPSNSLFNPITYSTWSSCLCIQSTVVDIFSASSMLVSETSYLRNTARTPIEAPKATMPVSRAAFNGVGVAVSMNRTANNPTGQHVEGRQYFDLSVTEPQVEIDPTVRYPGSR